MEHIVFTTAIPNSFIDKYLPSANPTFSVIYIYGFRQYSKGAEEISCENLAEDLGLLASDVVKAWEYWEKAGAVKILSRNGEKMSLAFINTDIKKEAKAETQEVYETEEAVEDIAEVEEVKVFKTLSQALDEGPETEQTELCLPEEEMPKRPVVKEFPEYSLKDIEKHLCDPEVGRLFYMAESYMGKLLTDVERRMFLAFYDDLGLPVDVIEVLVDYCVTKNKTHNNYISTVARDWAERGIATLDQAEEYISLFNNEYREILRYFGISGREPIDKEISFMHKWMKEDNFSMDVIKLACERTIMNKANPNFSYADGILRKWKQDNITTIEQIKNLEKTYYDNIKTVNGKRSSAKSKKEKPKFQNYEGRTWDYDKLAQMENEYLDRKIADNM